MSGAGRTQFGNHLEDLGWYVIDNLPPSLLVKVADITFSAEHDHDRVALAVGAGAARELEASIAELRAAGIKVHLVFLDASDDALIRRYESTKRRHPHLLGESLAEAIERERKTLEGVRSSADLTIDTTNLTPYALKERVTELYAGDEFGDSMRTTVMSFGYKHGIPADVDIVMDCRFLANPYWVERLRPLTGHDAEIIDYLFAQPDTKPFLDRLTALLELLVPAYRAEGKSYLTIALGCTGGRHRSVAMAENLAARLTEFGVDPRVYHRDLGR
ncbi:MAG: RNase adapter RapZ [Actinobacteria bacterium]|nr:RNase adapter RapZ [Actinomycetota bacterium]